MVRLSFDRRGFLRALGWSLAALAAPGRALARGRGLGAGPPTRPDAAPHFFTDHERATLDALCDRIVPADADPGAVALGAPAYIEALLTTFEAVHPRVFARGPFSGRNPYPNTFLGTPSLRYPPNFFERSVAPDRLQELYWRTEILGSEAAGLPAYLAVQQGGPRLGLRDVYRAGLARVDEFSVQRLGLPFAELGATDQERLLQRMDLLGVFPPDPSRGRSFLDLLILHTLEGCFAPPEYGGNANLGGWRLVGLEGDVQPLGYSIYSTRTRSYHERPAHPMSTPNPDELAPDGSVAPRPLSADGAALQRSITAFTRLLETLDPGSKP